MGASSGMLAMVMLSPVDCAGHVMKLQKRVPTPLSSPSLALQQHFEQAVAHDRARHPRAFDGIVNFPIFGNPDPDSLGDHCYYKISYQDGSATVGYYLTDVLQFDAVAPKNYFSLFRCRCIWRVLHHPAPRNSSSGLSSMCNSILGATFCAWPAVVARTALFLPPN